MEKPPKSIPAMTLCLIAAILLLIGTASAAPSADFSGTPTSGTAPLTVDFTDESTGSPTGWAWFFGDETYDQAWTPVSDSPGWARQNHASVAMPDGSIVLMGGYYVNTMNDVWRSDDGGATWTRVNASAGWSARMDHAAVAVGDSIVLMGGYTGGMAGSQLNDVWRSDDGGETWTQLPDPGWSARNNHAAVAMPDGSIVLMG
ncbi:MAG: hypothetical protein PWR16_1385, partial [Methanoculleus sp.]|nr:hypothetical protein [Methanoculleus sp.]